MRRMLSVLIIFRDGFLSIGPLPVGIAPGFRYSVST